MQLWEDSFAYRLGRVYVDGCTRGCFRRCIVTGKDNIPSDGAVIFAGNHCNTLMDALVILRVRIQTPFSLTDISVRGNKFSFRGKCFPLKERKLKLVFER